MKKPSCILKNQNGISLVVVLLFLTAAAIVAYGAASLAVKVRDAGEQRNTVRRMETIRQAMVKFYRGKQNLPTVPGDNSVPVGANNLNLESKFRQDAWGRTFHYNASFDTTGTPWTQIEALTVNGRAAAGVIVSSGPDQVFDSFNTAAPGTTYPDTGAGFTLNDDVIVPIIVRQEALEIATTELNDMQKKVVAYCLAGAPIGPNPSLENSTDPPAEVDDDDGDTIDFMSYYGLPDRQCCAPVIGGIDPWLNTYVWGWLGYPFDVAGAGNLAATDTRYHRFFSKGPDGQSGNSDDIIAVGPLPSPPCVASGPTNPTPPPPPTPPPIADGPFTIEGTDGNDNIHGTGFEDKISGGAGDDTIDAGNRDDYVEGNDGNDGIDGGNGNDYLLGGGGNDTINGNNGDDAIFGGEGDDNLDGGPGDDWIDGEEGNDTILGGADNDILIGNTGDDPDIQGGSGDDIIFGWTGNDVIRGDQGADIIYGGTGDDTIDGGSQDDELFGGPGNDAIDGGGDTDRAYFDGSEADYIVTSNGDGSGTVTGGPDGDDTLVNVEILYFFDDGADSPNWP